MRQLARSWREQVVSQIRVDPISQPSPASMQSPRSGSGTLTMDPRRSSHAVPPRRSTFVEMPQCDVAHCHVPGFFGSTDFSSRCTVLSRAANACRVPSAAHMRCGNDSRVARGGTICDLTRGVEVPLRLSSARCAHTTALGAPASQPPPIPPPASVRRGRRLSEAGPASVSRNLCTSPPSAACLPSIAEWPARAWSPPL